MANEDSCIVFQMANSSAVMNCSYTKCDVGGTIKANDARTDVRGFHLSKSERKGV